ncbi:MAG: HNH endonuclease [Bdellovibrionaceae bacterium]|nr:HNH endonuclease [Pseudobdellovibrionaceae bacterium]
MENLPLLSNEILVTKLRGLIQEEREISLKILELINEVERRRLHLELGYPSLFDWLTRDLGYSAAAAMRRIDSARLLRKVPTIAKQIESGKLNLTNLARVQSAIRAEEKRTGKQIEPEQLVNAIEGKSSREVEQHLAQTFPNSAYKADSARAITDNQIRLQVTLSTPQYSELERAREVASHSHFGAPMGEVIGMLAADYLDRKDPLRKKGHTEAVAGPEMTGRRPVPQNVRRLVFQRADGRCEYKNPHTGKVCGSRFQTQIDHIKPVALGGTNAVENLRLLCRAHNAWTAEEIFGPFVKN